MIKKLVPFLDHYKIYAILAPLAITAEVILEIFIPFLMAKMIDVGIGRNDMDYVIRTGLLMVSMALLSLVCGALAGRFSALASTGFAKNLRQGLFGKVQEFTFANIDHFSTASLITRLTTDVTNTQNAMQMMLRMLVRAPIMLVSATTMAVYINPRLSLIFVIAIPVMVLALSVIMKGAFPRFQLMLKKYDQMNGRIQENLIAIRVVKAYVREGYESEKFRTVAEELRNTQRNAEKLVVFTMPILQLVMYASMIAVSWYGGKMIIGGDVYTGEFMGFLSYVTQILMSLMMVGMIFVSLTMSRASVLRIVEILEEEIDMAKPDQKTSAKECADGSIVFDHVNFSYAKDEGNKTLEEINLEIITGETVGIIGGTGSGKTTLVQLIPRLYDVLSGRILVGGIDVREYDADALRNNVAMVLQNNVLFSGSIQENLKWGNTNATDEELIEACKAAQAHDFITSFPEGYETKLGQGGVNLSGGQKQRICIARALLKTPKIIILDDSTSAVDTETEEKIRKSFSESLGSVTTIIIAQRISSIRNADKIIVMEDGRIDAIGTHDELLNTNRIYQEVCDSQQKGVA